MVNLNLVTSANNNWVNKNVTNTITSPVIVSFSTQINTDRKTNPVAMVPAISRNAAAKLPFLISSWMGIEVITNLSWITRPNLINKIPTAP